MPMQMPLLRTRCRRAAGLIAGAKPKPVDPAGPKPLTVYAAFVKSQFAGAKVRAPAWPPA